MGKQMEGQPSTTTQLIGVIGQDAYARVQALHGGNTLKVPITNQAKAFGDWAEIIGQARAEALIKEFGGNEIYIPSGKLAQSASSAAKRNASILAEYDALTKTVSSTEAVRRLSLKFRLSNRWVYMILKRIW
jgi:hypothetical protein